MITERTLKRWRITAFKNIVSPKIFIHDEINNDLYINEIKKLSQCILLMTQELIDLHLMRGK